MTKIGIIGCGFVGDIHAASFRMVPGTEVAAVAARAPGKAKHFARERGIAHAFEDYRQLLAMREIDLVTLAHRTESSG
jgi:predicted dehydrogenase